jgi:phage terminase large subunit
VTAPAAQAAAVDNPFDQFIEQYGDDWVLLVREVLGADPDPFQQEILQAACRAERRISVRSGHGVGKTTVLAWVIICHALTRFPQKTICTAPTSAQLFDALAAETKAWFKKLPTAILDLFEIQTEQIRHKTAPEESFIAFRTSKPETPEAMAGVHSEHVLLIADEASGIPQKVFDAGAGSMSGEHATTILAGNPVRTTGLFYDSHNKPEVMKDWRRIHISCVGHPRVADDFIQSMAAQHGEDSNEYRVRVLGEFPKGDADTVIPRELAEAALRRDVTPLLVKPIWGLDCARFGSDKTALARRRGNVLDRPVEEKAGWDTMQIVGWVKAEYDALPLSERPTEINIDSIGIGAGVVDRLVELGLPARGINVSESPAMTDKYLNLRAELWFKGRDWLAARDCNLSDDELLVAELVEPRYKYTSNGKRQVESKEDMKKRGKQSPNKADSFLLTLASEPIAAQDGPSQRRSWAQPLKRALKGIV